MDWTGNKNSIFKTLGASNHTDKDRQAEDYYATDPVAAKLLLGVEHFEGPVWECACGQGHLAEVFREAGIPTRASDIIDRGYGEVFDFLSMENQSWDGDIITNPPYKWALDFIYKALTIIPDGRKVAMFLKVQFLEGKERRALYRSTPPQSVYVSSSRILCAKNGCFDQMRSAGGSAVAYAWFVWEKGYKGPTILKWIN